MTAFLVTYPTTVITPGPSDLIINPDPPSISTGIADGTVVCTVAVVSGVLPDAISCSNAKFRISTTSDTTADLLRNTAGGSLTAGVSEDPGLSVTDNSGNYFAKSFTINVVALTTYYIVLDDVAQTTFTVPDGSGFYPALTLADQVLVYAPGGTGGDGNDIALNAGSSGSAAGSGALSGIANYTFTPGQSLAIRIGDGGSQVTSFIKNIGGTKICEADYGRNGITSATNNYWPPGGLGGLAANCIGDTGMKFSGANGGYAKHGCAPGGASAPAPGYAGLKGGDVAVGGSANYNAGGGAGVGGPLATAGHDANQTSPAPPAGYGGLGPDGTGAGVPTTDGITPSGDGSAGGGGAGGYIKSPGSGGHDLAAAGGKGSQYPIWTRSSDGLVFGPGSGPGGGGGHQGNSSGDGPLPAGDAGAVSARSFAGGGAGGGGSHAGIGHGSKGCPGGIIIIYRA